jgi:hypothetical protein
VKVKGGLAAALALVLVAVAATPSQAASTRAEYIAQVEPICQAANEASKKHDRKVVQRIKPKLIAFLNDVFDPDAEEPSKKENRRFIRFFISIFAKTTGHAAFIFDQATTQIYAIPPVPGEEGLIGGWLAGRSLAVDQVQAAIRAARHGRGRLSGRLLDQSDKTLLAAQEPVNAYGFQACFVEIPADPISFARGLRRGSR